MIGQAEGFQINADNLISLLGGSSLFVGGNSASVGQSQTTANGGLNLTFVMQGQAGILNQGATAVGVGHSAKLSGSQGAGLVGQQAQSAGTSSQQYQDNSANLAQNFNISKGSGGLLLGQGYVIGQVQITAGPDGINGDADFSGISQLGGIIDAKKTNLMLSNMTAISAGQ